MTTDPIATRQRIKLGLLLALSLVFVVAGIHRLAESRHGGTSGSPPPGPGLPAAGAGMPQNQAPAPALAPAASGPFRVGLRDIFRPQAPPGAWPGPAPAMIKTEPVVPAHLELHGAIVGSGPPLAIINGQFYKVGDRLEGYQIMEIKRHRVVMAAGKHKFDLKTVENE